LAYIINTFKQEAMYSPGREYFAVIGNMQNTNLQISAPLTATPI